MFHENLKSLRKERGISQENLAMRLNVVRQTISKWETGASVPDAEQLMRIAEILEVGVSDLLGTRIEAEDDPNQLAVVLAHINEQLAIRNHRARRIWKIIGICLCIFVVFVVLILTINYAPM